MATATSCLPMIYHESGDGIYVAQHGPVKTIVVPKTLTSRLGTIVLNHVVIQHNFIDLNQHMM